MASRLLSRLADAAGLATFGASFGARVKIFLYASLLPLLRRLGVRRFHLRVAVDGRSAPLTLLPSHEEYLTFREVFLEGEYAGTRLAEEPKTIVDLGANIGLVSLFLALRHPHATLWAVEPNPALLPRLRENLGGLSNVRIEQVAVGAADGDATLGVSDVKPIASSLARRGPGFRDLSVPAETWETFCNRRGIECVDLLKCDAEGAEHAVLTSPAFAKVRVFVGEIHGDLMPESWEALRARLGGHRVVEERAGKAGRAIVRIYPSRPPLPASPRVSVVTAAWNRAATIGRSVRSVLAQGSAVAELIVIDDGSTDGTAEAARAAAAGDPRFRLISLPKNGGASAARNAGLRQATGDLLMVWDSDDELDPGAVEAALVPFRDDPTLGVVSAPCRFLSPGKPAAVAEGKVGGFTHGDILCRELPWLDKVRLARRELMIESPYVAANIDFLVNVELSERGRWLRLPDALGTVHDSTAAGSLTARRRVPSAARAAARAPHLARFIEADGAAMRRRCPGRFAGFAYGASLANLVAGNRRQAGRIAARGLGASPSFKLAALLCLAALPGGAWAGRWLVAAEARRRAASGLVRRGGQF